MEISILAYVPQQFKKIFSSGMTGEVMMQTSSGAYLCFEEEILFLCDITWGMVPIGIGVDDYKKLVKQLSIQEGQWVIARENMLIFPNGIVHLQMESTNTEEECIGQPEMGYVLQAAVELAALRKERGISMLVVPLVLGSEEPDATQRNPYCEQSYPHFVKLMNALQQGAEDEIRDCADKMLGLGIGLTPSVDDAIMGMLYVFRKLAQKCPQGVGFFKKSISELCDSHTNRISSAYLKAVIQGAHFKRMEHIWYGLCGIKTLDISVLTKVGSTSGTEMLLGMLIALRLCGYDVAEVKALAAGNASGRVQR